MYMTYLIPSELAGPPIQPAALHPHYLAVDHSYMTWAQQVGVRVNTWTVNDALEAQHLAALGVNVIMSDAPDVILAALG